MNEQIALVFTTFLYILILLIVARALISWFPVSRDNQLVRLLYQVTEPLLEPLRRILPKTGMIDFSAMIMIILLYVMIRVVNQVAES